MSSITLDEKLALQKEKETLEKRIIEISDILKSVEDIDIFEAIRTTDEKGIIAWLDNESSNPNATNEKDGVTPLIHVVRALSGYSSGYMAYDDISHHSEKSFHYKLIQHLPALIINKKGFQLPLIKVVGEDINGSTRFQTTLLRAVSGSHSSKSFLFLVDMLDIRGFMKPDELNTEGMNFLMEYFSQSAYETEEMVELFLKNGGDINAKDDKGMTALMHLINQNDITRNTAFLLKHPDVDLSLKDKDGKSTLFHFLSTLSKRWAGQDILKESLSILLDNSNPMDLLRHKAELQDILIEVPGAALRIIAEHPNFGKSILEEEYVGTKNKKYTEHYDSDKCRYIKTERTESLIDVIIEDNTPKTDLLFNIIEILSIDPSYPNRQNSAGKTILMHMVENGGSSQNKEYMIKKMPFKKLFKEFPQLDVNIQDRFGDTVIHMAIDKDNLPVTQGLIDYSNGGYDVNLFNDKTSKRENLPIALLNQSESGISKPFKKGFRKLAYDLITEHLSNHLDFSHVDHNGNPLIHYIKESSFNDSKVTAFIVETLFENMDDLNQTFHKGKHLLHYLVDSGLDKATIDILEKYSSTDELDFFSKNDEGHDFIAYSESKGFGINLSHKTMNLIQEKYLPIYLDKIEANTSNDRVSDIEDLMGLSR